LSIIRAWKDAEYRLGLSDAELEQLPAHPAGVMALEKDPDCFGSPTPQPISRDPFCNNSFGGHHLAPCRG
jgi:mersacidin/lichenicidin family type 2 lantibiotic